MPSLLELQEDCYRAFLLDAPEALLPQLSSREIPAATRVRVYQANAKETFRQALASSYPVIERLVGEACFRTLALLYMREHPSRCGDLADFGREFALFLEKQYGASQFAYLPDVARLERAIEAVLLAAEPVALDPADLGRLDPELLPNTVFDLSQAVCLVSSRYPIFTIWSANQPGREHDVDLAAGAQHIVVRRRAGDAELALLDPAAADLFAALAGGASLGEACDALADSPDFDVTRALGALLSHGCLMSFSPKRRD